jgi:hypothetical protein
LSCIQQRMPANLRSQFVISSFEGPKPAFGNAIRTVEDQKSKIADLSPFVTMGGWRIASHFG